MQVSPIKVVGFWEKMSIKEIIEDMDDYVFKFHN